MSEPTQEEIEEIRAYFNNPRTFNLNEYIRERVAKLFAALDAQKKRIAELEVSFEAQINHSYECGCLDVTHLLSKHPQDWDGPCVCAECLEAGEEAKCTNRRGKK